MVKTNKFFVGLIIMGMVLVLMIGTVLGYLYLNQEKSETKVIGTVDLISNLYHENIQGNLAARLVNLGGVSKSDVYDFNVYDPNSLYHINSVRLNFNNNSNIEIYLRVKIYSALTLVFESNEGELTEYTTISEIVPYAIDKTKWFYNVADQYYYYLGKIDPTVNEISFIEPGLFYDLKQPQNLVQFSYEYEAVQAHLGPNNNQWPQTPPWNESGMW